MTDRENKQRYTRRDMLKMGAVTGSSLVIGASGFGLIANLLDPPAKTAKVAAKTTEDVIPFYGEHQAGIITPQQTYMYLASFELMTESKQEVVKLFKRWTKLGELFTVGNWELDSANKALPPNDTGESIGFSPGNLTMLLGLGPTFFWKNGKDRLGLAHKMPKFLKKIPNVGNQKLDPNLSDGDICIQVCSEDKQVVFHAIRNLIKEGVGTVSLKWLQDGFFSGAKGETKRNLFGFKDGTANPSLANKKEVKEIVWAGSDEPSWMVGGTYLAYRKIRMFIEEWDQDSLQDQEDTLGRRKQSGAPMGKVHEFDEVDASKMPVDSHVRITHTTGDPILRRSYNYANGVDALTGKMEAGLAFISFQKNPWKSFFPKLKKMGESDALNEYTMHIGSALFAVPRGVKKGEYIAQPLFEL
ncbi:iron uptake transporter deferrochelatase/peroxidase subunit [Pullulanibacillus sp. KACC 23026]|uniref:iron uptake transporter deferrochelatase/peroxidase subunit n=1 Tax=Pullulanibacillus sp. KACC 23026 TaxID=3028315 RepID=UPI0023B05026|nr:iron uptake transporter deferrochelatase/peroxidase subunit [Pullulanibacillus sp. KACC 23026]WEG13715.1 iron uptake transporter deferrochelatase/peroxidase subunit [Pullulanibacillus sp. KACC 23026]